MERKHRKMSRAIESARAAMAMVSGWDPGSLFKVRALQAPLLVPKDELRKFPPSRQKIPHPMQASSIKEAPPHARI